MSNYRLALKDLLQGFEVSGLNRNPDVSGLSQDSRDVCKGGLFVALKGEHVDARQFIPAAFKQGAVAVLVDAAEQSADPGQYCQMNGVICMRHLRAGLSRLAARFYRYPAKKLSIIGITGTNGKTTIAWYLAQVLQFLKASTGIMGTLGAGKINALKHTGLTTPDAIQVQQRLAEMYEAGVRTVCMEVSSHALELGRISEVEFNCVVFSNLSQDHLDFHQNMQQYATAKMRLFERGDFSTAVINHDDATGRKIIEFLAGSSMSYGIERGDIHARDIKLRSQGLQFTVSTGDQSVNLDTRLIGKFNVYNLLAVLGAGVSLGYPLAKLAGALQQCAPVPGRMQRVEGSNDQPVVVVDYAHTPDALDKALSACREHCRGSLAVVFGCGGDRDKAKRPEMGRIAECLADQVYITDDNPRSERPTAIIVDIQRGMATPAWVLHNRSQAIQAAITRSGRSDWVLIAGKGHETRQVYADRTLEFSDCLQAKRVLERQAA